jgi:hypothetical protein
MTKAQAHKKIDVARKTGRARFYDETDSIRYDIWFDPDTNEFSLTYRDGHYEQTVICTSNTNRIIELITA